MQSTWGAERLFNLPKVTQLVRGRAKLCILETGLASSPPAPGETAPRAAQAEQAASVKPAMEPSGGQLRVPTVLAVD